jgi:ABC-2 type transport system ATP-binding protein
VTAALSLRGLGKDYGERTAVVAIDLDVAAGEFLGLLGPNGAGKTTTIAMACGVLPPSRGRIFIAGIDLRAEPRAAKVKLGYVPQELALYGELSAVQNLRYFGALYGLGGATLEDRIAWALDLVALADRASERVKAYSGGMQRRLNLAASLLHRPELLILDEPTAGVDPQSRAHLFDTLRALHERGTSIVYTSHYLEEIELLCKRVAILDHGAIIATGTPDELSRAHASNDNTRGTRLESAFLALTGRALRDVS